MTLKKVLIRIAIILLIISVYQGYNSLTDIFRWIERNKTGLSEKSVQVGDHKIVYLEGGKGEAIILLHGFGDSKDCWTKFARGLTKKYQVIAPDLPGFGESTKNVNSKYDIASQVKRIHEFAKQLGIKKFHIAGNSMGGLISGIYTADYPDQVLSLGLLDAGGVADREPSEIAKKIVNGSNPLIIEVTGDYDTLLNFMFYKAPSIPGVIKRQLAAESYASREFNKKVFVEALPGNQLELRFKDIKTKTLVIWGDTDRVFPASSAKVIQQGIKGSKMIIIKECGHLPMTEKPFETAKYYEEFLI